MLVRLDYMSAGEVIMQDLRVALSGMSVLDSVWWCNLRLCPGIHRDCSRRISIR